MPDPRKREHVRVGTWNDEIGIHPTECARVGIWAARISSSFNKSPLEEIEKPVSLCRGPWIPEPTSWPMMR